MATKEVNSGAPDAAVLAEMGEGSNLPAHRQSGEFVLGQVDDGDVGGSGRPPRLQIAYGVGKLAVLFSQGDLVLNGDTMLVGKGEPLNIIVLGTTSYWKEYLGQEAYAANIHPRTFNTREEVLAVGGTVAWSKDPVSGKSIGPTFSGAMDVKMLIEQPEGIVSGLFGVPLGNKLYAAAEYTVDKQAFGIVSGVINNAAKFALRTRGIYSATFELKTVVTQKAGKTSVLPSIKLLEHLTDDVVAEIKAFFPAPCATAEALPA